MITYRDLFFHYLESDAYDEQIEKTLKEKTLERDFSFDNELELIFLYRQARIFNIESELEISSNSPNYLRKRKKVLRFFAFLDIADSDGLHLFSYSEENKTINMRGFLLLCSWYSFNNNDYIKGLLNEMAPLYDAESLSEFLLHFVELAMMKKRKVPEIVKIALDMNVYREQFANYFDYMDSNLIDQCDDVERHRLSFLFCNINFIRFKFSNKAKSFLLLADEMYNALSASTFADFSIVSLQYYKTIEVELKNFFIIPALANIKSGILEVGTVNFQMRYFSPNKLTLGNISVLFDKAIDYLENGNTTSCSEANVLFYKNLVSVCNLNVEYLRFFRDITSQKFINRFRNPPAHTEPLAQEEISNVERIFMNFVDNLRCVSLNISDKPDRFKIVDIILNSK